MKALASPALQRQVRGWKVVSFLFSFLCLGVILWSWKETGWARIGPLKKLREFRSREAIEKSRFRKEWEKVKRRLEKEWESEAKLAVIEADQMLDRLLERLGYPGENLSEQLKKMEEERLPNREELEKARRIRDDIVHDPDYRFGLEKARWVLDVYEKTFTDLNAL